MGKLGVLPGIVQVLHDVTFRLLFFQLEWAHYTSEHLQE